MIDKSENPVPQDQEADILKVRYGEPIAIPHINFANPFLEDSEGYGDKFIYAEIVVANIPLKFEDEDKFARIKVSQSTNILESQHPVYTPSGVVSATVLLDNGRSTYDLSSLPVSLTVGFEMSEVDNAKDDSLLMVLFEYKNKRFIGEPYESSAYINDELSDLPFIDHALWYPAGVDTIESRLIVLPPDPQVISQGKITFLKTN